MLQAFGLSCEPSPLAGTLFTDVDLAIDDNEKVALVGPNGCGKSSLLRILAGEILPNKGRVVVGKYGSVAYLPQDFEWDDPRTVEEFLFEAGHFEEAAAIARSAGKLGISEDFYGRAFSTLSLGERMRCALARLLAPEPHILLLDEPTNHLDITAREWLEQFLASCRQSVLMVCHDRTVTNRVVSRVLELAGGSLHSWTGNYDAYAAAKESQTAYDLAEWQKEKDEDRRLRIAAEAARQRAAKVLRKPTQRDYDPYAKGFYSAMEARVAKRAKAIETRVAHARAEAIDKPFVGRALALTFSCAPLRLTEVLRVRGLSYSYDLPLTVDGLPLTKQVLTGVNLTLGRGERIAVVGPNGCGKTTLFRLLLGELTPTAGSIEWSPGVQIGYLSQARGLLDPSQTVSEALDSNEARTLLGRLGMRGTAGEKQIGVLSVGERTKAELVGILLSPCNVLILDEPTNHLDLESLEVLEQALTEFPGCVVFASHDRAFVERVATEVIDLD